MKLTSSLNILSSLSRNLVTDTSYLIPTKNGTLNSIYFDNGGTTPPFISVIHELEKYTPWNKYVSNNSAKAKFLSDLYEESRISIKNFVNADLENDTIIYTKNTTEAINILSNVICSQFSHIKSVVLTTYMEHLSDYLPWVFRCETILVDVDANGKLSISDLETKLIKYQDRVKLVAVTGASNVTGYVNPIHDIARLSHTYGAQILVDAAQLIQHRQIDMHPTDTMERIDYLAFSAHKTYAPFFSGALIGNREVLNLGYPLCFGAGSTTLVTDTNVILKDSPQRYEAGSNNLLGAIALAVAIQTLIQINMHNIKNHETYLLSYAMQNLVKNPNVIIYGDTNQVDEKVPIIAFNIKDKTCEEVAQYLYDDYGIIVKNGLCGADLYVKKLISGSSYKGVVRISMGLYNQDYELDRLVEALEKYN